MLQERQFTNIPFFSVPNASGIAVIVLFSILLGLTWISVILRIITRVLFVRPYYDDLFMVITLAFYTIYNALVITMEVLARGLSSIPEPLLRRVTTYLITCECFYTLSIITFKISLGFFFYRLIQERWQQILLLLMVTLSTLIGIAYFLFIVFQCGVPNHGDPFWLKQITGQCVSGVSIIGLGYTHAIINALTDVILCALPIPLILRAKISVREKFIVSAIVLVAAIGSIASISRLGYIKTLNAIGPQFWVKIQALAIVSAIEVGLGIIAASLATIRPLFRKFVESLKSYLSYRSVSGPSSGSYRSHQREHEQDAERGRKPKSIDPDSIDTNKTTTTVDSDARYNFLLSATGAQSTTDSGDSSRPGFAAIAFPTRPLDMSETMGTLSTQGPNEQTTRAPEPKPKPKSRSRLRQQPQRPTARSNEPATSSRQEPRQDSRDRSSLGQWWDLRMSRRHPGLSTVHATFGSATGSSSIDEEHSRERREGEMRDTSSTPSLEPGFRRYVIRRE